MSQQQPIALIVNPDAHKRITARLKTTTNALRRKLVNATKASHTKRSAPMLMRS